MATVELTAGLRPVAGQPIVVRAVTVIMGTVVGLTFLFGFGNVLTLALRLGVPLWVAPLVAPAVDLSILGLLLGTRHLALHGATPDQFRPARRPLVFASLATLALNVADPIVAGDYGKAAFDAVGPLLLIGWAEVGPGLLQAIAAVAVQLPGPLTAPGERQVDAGSGPAAVTTDGPNPANDGQTSAIDRELALNCDAAKAVASRIAEGDLVQRAKEEDARHWAIYQRPISAETLRKRLRVGAARSRMLVSTIRADQTGRRTLNSTR